MASFTVLRFLFLLLIVSAAHGQTVTSNSPSQNSENVEDAKLRYDRLVNRVKTGDSTVDFIELISAASDWDLAQKTSDIPDRDEMVTAFKNKDYKKAASLAESVLNYEFTNHGLHKQTENAYRQIGDSAKADFHRDIADRIFQALLRTGDGQTPQSAYCVQGIREEYLIMKYFGYDVTLQAYLTSGESSYDMLSGTNKKSGKKSELYFDISGHFTRCIKSHATH